MEFYAQRWSIGLGTKGWRSYVSLGGVLGDFNLNIKHLQVIFRFSWEPRWPGFLFSEMPAVKFFDRVLAPENTRWTALNAGIQFWPIIFSVHWHATCHGCVAEYGRDHEEYKRLRYG